MAALTVCSFNMHGFTNSNSYLKDLCLGNDLIFVQEHWLLSQHLSKFNSVSDSFLFYGVSAMDTVCSQGILRGRPFGGVGVLVRKSFSSSVSLCGFHHDNRAVAVKFEYDDVRVLCFGVYFPCDRSSHDYNASINSIIGFIESVIDTHPGYKILIMGDFNFQCVIGDKGFDIFSQFARDLDLVSCDYMDNCAVGYTYFHESLGHRSFIDHIFIQTELVNTVQSFKIIDDSTNLSDHLPISICLSLPSLRSDKTNLPANRIVQEFRWDKGDCSGYYAQTGEMLGRISHALSCELLDSNCIIDHCHADIDIYYAEIVHCLIESAKCNIPSIPANALKHYWSDALNDLKSDSIFTYSIWKSSGRPQSGSVYEMYRNAKYRYKLAIRDAVNQFENKFNDELLESYMTKNFNKFWQSWKKKTCSKSPRTSCVSGCTKDIDIANKFAEYFSTVCDVQDHSMSEYSYEGMKSYDTRNCLFTVEDVDYVINHSLQKGKAAGDDNITAEHILYAHPRIILHLCRLFNLMMKHGYVPVKFGSGVIVPIIKDRLGDATKLDNYRAITIGSVISKIFELCVSSKFDCFLSSNELQFGFKKGIGCANAVYVVQQVIQYFNSRGSSVYASSLDASKAFDRINHTILTNKLIERNVPTCLINVVINWYGKLTAAVRWNGIFSNAFAISCGVRQGSVLSPLLFNIYVDDLISQLTISNLGCYIGCNFFGCIMYADDIILLSASVTGLQSMLDICYDYGRNHYLIFNSKKSVCCAFGSCSAIDNMKIGDVSIAWVRSFKYLGITFNSDSKHSIDIEIIKRKFYAACNSVLSHCKGNNELVKLHLVKSYCLPLLTYCLGAIQVPQYKVRELGVCWNDCFRKIFRFQRWESVKELQWYLNELPFDYIYDLCRWKFLANRKYLSCSIAMLLDISNLQYGYLVTLTDTYCDGISSKYHCVHDLFRSTALSL